MLAFYQRWAYRLYPFRLLYITVFLIAVAGFCWLLFAASATLAGRWQLSTVLLALISLLLWLWAVLFSKPLPDVRQAQSFSGKIKLRLHYMLYYLLALWVTLLLLATTYLGLRVLKGIIATLFFS